MTCDYPNLAAAIVTSDGVSSFQLHDHLNGYELMSELPRPRWNDSAPRVTSVYMNGSVATAPATTTDAVIPIRLRIEGETRAQIRTREDALWAAWKAEDAFLLDIYEDLGVGWRYRAERVAYDPSPITIESLILVTQSITLSFLVQPDPVDPEES